MSQNKLSKILGVLILAVAIFFFGCDRNIQAPNQNQTNAVTSEFSVGQSFYSGRANLSSIKILLYNSANLHLGSTEYATQVNITMHLRELGSKSDLRTESLTIETQKDPLHLDHRFSFAPIADSGGHYYYFLLSSDMPANLDGIHAFFGEIVNDRTGGQRFENNQAVGGMTVFDLGYDDSASDIWSHIIHNIFQDQPFILFYFVLLLINILLIVYFYQKPFNNRKE